MRKDTAVNQYFSDNQRFADLFNHTLFKGERVVIPSALKDTGNTANVTIDAGDGKRSAQSRIRDVVKKQDDASGMTWMLFGIENQTQEHYYMPVRGMLYDSLSYMEQVRLAEREHRLQESGIFETDLKLVLGLLRYQDDIIGFQKFIGAHQGWFTEMAEDAYDVLSVFLKNKRQLKQLKDSVKTEGGGINMCKAIDMLQEDAKLAGLEAGKAAGKIEGIDAMVTLAKKLWEEGRIGELIEAAEDQGKKGNLLSQYQMLK